MVTFLLALLMVALMAWVVWALCCWVYSYAHEGRRSLNADMAEDFRWIRDQYYVDKALKEEEEELLRESDRWTTMEQKGKQ